MKNQSIWFTSPCVAELLDQEIPTLAADEVLVKIVRTTLSAGTERANLVGDPNVSPTKTEVKFPRRSGYSASGVIVEVGSAVEGLSVGDRVACSWSQHVRYCNLKASRVYKLADDVDFDEAASE